jgi:hypothetical protein
VILRCTRKLLTVLGSAVAEPAPPPDPEDWYANLLWFDRRTCLLLTHSATLFTIFEADVTASGLRATRQLVTGLIGRELRREELPPGTFGDLGQQKVLLATTADRSVLGCMNDMAFRCEHAGEPARACRANGRHREIATNHMIASNRPGGTGPAAARAGLIRSGCGGNVSAETRRNCVGRLRGNARQLRLPVGRSAGSSLRHLPSRR